MLSHIIRCRLTERQNRTSGSEAELWCPNIRFESQLSLTISLAQDRSLANAVAFAGDNYHLLLKGQVETVQLGRRTHFTRDTKRQWNGALLWSATVQKAGTRPSHRFELLVRLWRRRNLRPPVVLLKAAADPPLCGPPATPQRCVRGVNTRDFPPAQSHLVSSSRCFSTRHPPRWGQPIPQL